MATIVFVVSDKIGHIHSTFRIAGILGAGGHDVVYVGVRAVRTLIERQGFRFREAPFLNPYDAASAQLSSQRNSSKPNRPSITTFWSHRRELRQRRCWHIQSLIVAADVLIEELQPDLLVFDPFALTTYFAFQRRGLSAVALSANPLLDWDPMVPPYTSYLVPQPTLWSKMRVSVAWGRSWMRYLAYAASSSWKAAHGDPSELRIAAELAAATGLSLRKDRIRRPVWFDLRLRSVPELVLWPEAFDFPRSKPLRNDVHYIGACVAMERLEGDFDWKVVPARSRLVYCSLGTVELPCLIGERTAFLQKVVGAFELLPDYALVLATGDTICLDLRTPRNVLTVREAPQLALLRHADLFITHGGANSIKESILSGVPMLVYPWRADQPGNAARVVYHRLGLRCAHQSATPENIAANVRNVVENISYRASVVRVRQIFMEPDQNGAALRTLELYLRDRARTHVQ